MASLISTGIYRVDHSINHDRYTVFTQARQRGVEITVTSTFSTHFICEVRNNSGALVLASFNFQAVGDNYP